MHLGPDDLLLAAKVDFDHSLTVAELAHGHRRGGGRRPSGGAQGHQDLHRARYSRQGKTVIAELGF